MLGISRNTRQILTWFRIVAELSPQLLCEADLGSALLVTIVIHPVTVSIGQLLRRKRFLGFPHVGKLGHRQMFYPLVISSDVETTYWVPPIRLFQILM